MDNGVQDRILVDVARLDGDGEAVRGEAAIVDIDEEFAKASGPARYDLFVQSFGKELLARGSLEQDFDLVCSRCGRDFRSTVKVADFTVSAEVPEREAFADLTEDARESVILELPNFPVCGPDCPGAETESRMPADDRWSALDGLQAAAGRGNG